MTEILNTTETPYVTELTKTLKVLTAKNTTERNALIDKYFTHRNLPVLTDKGVMQKHELMRSETLDGAAILVPDLVRTINEGARPALTAIGQMYTTLNTTSNQIKIPRGNSGSFGSYAPIVAEGATTPVDDNRILYSNVNMIKTRTIAEITREMLRDSELDLVSYEVAAAGSRAANTIQSIALCELMAAATASAEKVTDKTTFKTAINKEIANIQKRGYIPDTVMLTPMAGAWLREELLTGYYEGNDPQNKGTIPRLYGLNCLINPIAPAKSEKGVYTPGAGTFGGTNGIGAIVYAKDKAAAVVTREAIGLDGDFRDIYKDLEALAVSARFGCGPIHNASTGDVPAAVYISA